MRVLVTGGGGFVGSHLVERLEAGGHEVVAARRRDHDLTSMDDTARLFADTRPDIVFHSPPRWAGSARTGRTRAASSTPT